MTRLILPCAGYGTRMQMSLDKSKELLEYKGKPLIEFSLSLAATFDLTPLVITRAEKQDLIQYCKEREIETKIIEVSGEWPDTILKSQDKWTNDNILMLPDTVFDPEEETIASLIMGLRLGNNAVFALHKVEDPSKWGVIDDYVLHEKPTHLTKGYAWGVIGFKGSYGKTIFSHCSKKYPLILHNTGFTYMNNFKDLTRTGKIE